MQQKSYFNSSRGTFWGGILILLGFLLLLDNLGLFHVDIWGIFFAVVIIALGVRMFRRPRHLGNTINVTATANIGGETGSQAFDNNILNDSTVAGEIEHFVNSKAFRGGNLNNVFGDVMVDLSTAELADGVQTISMNTVFGSVKIILPQSIEYALEANTVFGEVRINIAKRGGIFSHILYRSLGYDAAAKKLDIIASTVFGEVKIITRP